MKLCLVRHGNAVSHDVDALRALSDKGKEEAKEAGRFIQDSDFRPEKIFHSELLRAKETALLIASQISTEISLQEASDLLPNSPTSVWSHNVMGMDQDIMLVGHMPYMGILASELSATDMVLPTGGVIILDVQGPVDIKVLVKNF